MPFEAFEESGFYECDGSDLWDASDYFVGEIVIKSVLTAQGTWLDFVDWVNLVNSGCEDPYVKRFSVVNNGEQFESWGKVFTRYNQETCVYEPIKIGLGAYGDNLIWKDTSIVGNANFF